MRGLLDLLETIKKSRDFRLMRGEPSFGTRSFLIIKRHRDDGNEPRVGFTVTKKIGSAVTRNRIRRRLKSAAHEIFPTLAEVGADYVVIARRAAETCAFEQITNDMHRALSSLAKKPK